MDVNYVGENLLPGKIGQFFVILSFGAALLSFISYFFATREPHLKSWKKLGRIGFWLNAFSIVVIASTLFYIIYNHLFEYHYAWAHSSRSLPTHFIISCFWEGQEEVSCFGCSGRQYLDLYCFSLLNHGNPL